MVISRKIAKQHPNADGGPKQVGDKILIGGKPFDIIGLYETGSMLLDVVMVMDIETARGAAQPAQRLGLVHLRRGKRPGPKHGSRQSN